MWILMASYVLSEMIAFPPILGPGSLYLTYITGNLQNQKIPCALVSNEYSWYRSWK